MGPHNSHSLSLPAGPKLSGKTRVSKTGAFANETRRPKVGARPPELLRPNKIGHKFVLISAKMWSSYYHLNQEREEDLTPRVTVRNRTSYYTRFSHDPKMRS